MGMSWIELLKERLNDFYKLEMWVWEKFIKPSLIMALWLFGLSAVLGLLVGISFFTGIIDIQDIQRLLS